MRIKQKQKTYFKKGNFLRLLLVLGRLESVPLDSTVQASAKLLSESFQN